MLKVQFQQNFLDMFLIRDSTNDLSKLLASEFFACRLLSPNQSVPVYLLSSGLFLDFTVICTPSKGKQTKEMKKEKKNSIKYMYDIKIQLSHAWMQRVSV